MTSATGTKRRRLRRAAGSAIVALAFGTTSFVAVGCTRDDSTGTTSVATSTDTLAPASTMTVPGTAAPSTPASTTAPTGTAAPSTPAPGSTAGPTAPVSSVPVTTDAPAESMVLSAYFVRDERVATVHRTVEATVATSRAALSALLAGPTAAEAEIGFATGIPAATELEAVSIGPDGVATVEMSPTFEEGGGSLAMRLRLAQVVFTLTQFATVTGVQLASDGEPVDVFGPEGIVLDGPLTRGDFEDLTPAILVEGPAPFDVVGNPLRVYGTANVFEAAFMVRLTDTTGNVVYEGPQMATSGTGTRGTFDLTIDTAGVASGRAELRLWEASARDGSDVNVVTIPLELTG